MACSLPPHNKHSPQEENEDEGMVRVERYGQCSFSVDPVTKTAVLILHNEDSLTSGEILPSIAFNERGLVQAMMQLRTILDEVRAMSLTPKGE